MSKVIFNPVHSEELQLYPSTTEFGSPVTVDTRANILATTPSAGKLAFATDTGRFYVYDGSNWKESAIGFSTNLAAPDMGYVQDSSRKGYGDDYVTDKVLSNSVIGSNNRTDNGAIKINIANDPDTFEIYLRSQWNTIIYDLTTTYGDFRHTPLSKSVYVWRGDSVQLGLNERPIIQEYGVSMGAFPPAQVIYGGTF